MSKYELLKEQSNIPGQVKDYNQKIQHRHYPREGDKPQKLAEYFMWIDPTGVDDKARAIRSTYFSTVKDLENHLKNVAYCLGYFMEKKDKFGPGWTKQIGKLSKDIGEEIKKGRKKAGKN